MPLIVDATCANPTLMRPIAWEADIVVHSLSKSITASGLAIGGAIISCQPIITRLKNLDPKLKENFAEYLKFWPARDYGSAISPFNALLILNDLRTLRMRMDFLSQNCLKVAEFLYRHPRVSRFDYLGLTSHRLHSPDCDYLKLVDSDDGRGQPVNRYGHLWSFRVEGTPDNARKVFNRLYLIFRPLTLDV